MEEKENLYWRKLDNSAKIFPLSVSKKYSTVFRISCVLKEKVSPKILKQAVQKALQIYPFFKVRLKAGLFWYYLEENSKEPIIEKESNYPCKYIDPFTNAQYLFKVTYFDEKINIDINHALTDGNSATNFFKEIIYHYIELSHPVEFTEEIRTIKKAEYNEEDSYIKNYNKKAKSNASSKKAYIIKGRKIALGAISTIHEIINFEQLKELCKKKQVTVTMYLTAVLIYSIYEANYKLNNGKKPIKVCIPVNLKKYFNSSTMSNFFSYITVEAQMKNLSTFEEILEFVKQDFTQKLELEEITKTMSANVKIGTNAFIKGIPLILKKIFVRIGYIEIRKYTTITFSNIGRMGIIGEYQNYIDEFLFMIAPEPVEKIKCSACTFNNKLAFTFTGIIEDTKIENTFYNFIKAQGIEIYRQSNGVLDINNEKGEE